MNNASARLRRLEFLAHVIQAGRDALPWCGNIALQKLVYLLQAVYGVDLGYRYGLHQYGPYSPELADDIALGEAAGRWAAWDESFSKKDGTIAKGRHFEVSPQSPFSESVQQLAEKEWEKVRDKVARACKSLKQIPARGKKLYSRDLELVATLHYLRDVQAVDNDELTEVLTTLKPKFTAQDVMWGLERLQVLERAANAA